MLKPAIAVDCPVCGPGSVLLRPAGGLKYTGLTVNTGRSIECVCRFQATPKSAQACMYVCTILVWFALQKANVSSVKYQVCRLIRMLVHICKTLDSMPAEVYLAFNAASFTMSFARQAFTDASKMSYSSSAMVKLCVTEEVAANVAEIPVHEAHIS